VGVSTFIVRLEPTGGTAGVRIAVKDLIDVAGLPTTAGCRAVAQTAMPAAADAACLAGVRAEIEAGRARIVGKTNLDELAAGASGVNPWYGTPRNPLDPGRIPGGSSSGSAVAVADDSADIGFGTDTGGSVRIPAACCGVTGLKTTWGRVSLDGVFPLSQSLDTVGPLARDIAGVVAGMRLLEPGFSPAPASAHAIGRVRLAGVDPAIDAAIDRALAEAELEVVDVEIDGWTQAFEAALVILLGEAWANNRRYVQEQPNGVSTAMIKQLQLGRDYDPATRAAARAYQVQWHERLSEVLQRVELLAAPTLAGFAPPLADFEAIPGLTRTMELNLAGVPALAQPVRAAGELPASLQLFGPHGSEELLVSTGARVEAAAGALLR
jgi:amidase